MKKVLGYLMVLTVMALPLGYAKNEAKSQDDALLAKKAEINNSEWQVHLKSASGKAGEMDDTLTFKEGKFESQMTAKDDFKPTNTTVTIQEGGPTIWETMQTSEKGGVVFWRGEWDGEKMNGVMSKQISEGKNEDYHFYSTGTKKLDAPVETVEEAVAPAEEAMADATAIQDVTTSAEEIASEATSDIQEEVAAVTEEEAPKKKKKGWF
jgi:hypothetical protein